MTEQNDGLSAASALDAAMDAVVVASLADHLDEGDGKPSTGAPLPPNCLNCGALVRGRYCIDCGQVTDTHVPTLAEVIGDAFTSLFNLDSRLWRTLWALAVKPGQLTVDFLAGKRARYLPPLRLYLVMSVIFFLVASIEGDNDDDAENPDVVENVRSINEQVAAELEAEGITDLIEADLADDADPDPDLPGRGVNFVVDDDGSLQLQDSEGNSVDVARLEDCDEMNVPFSDRGEALDTAIREACADGVEDDFDSLKDAFADNIPLLTFMVIPVMAAVFKLFYLFTGRAYLGHLVFLCHTHAYSFLLIVVLLLLQMVSSMSPGLNGAITILGFTLLLLYTPVYYFVAMRRVYAQHWLLTFSKLVALMLIYFVAIFIVFSVGFVVVMLTN
jgi:hypothetical protein